ncbi:MAG: hypothetical protein LW768_06455, partial [Rubrivivax sp.]|nr:hypothetical protein [Rubrivivax sp.]
KLGHGAAARWLQERTQGRGAEFLAMTGDHAERAGEIALAIDCFEQAGQEAQKRFANAAAASWLRRALVLLGESAPARRLRLLGQLEALADTLGDRPTQEALHDQMAALLVCHPDDQGHALLCWCRALLADRRSLPALALSHCEQASALAESSGAAHTASRARGLLGWLHLSRDDYAGAQHHVEMGLRWAARIEAQELRTVAEAQLFTITAMILIERNRFEEARTALLAVLSRGQALGLPRLQASALDNLAEAARRQGRWDEVVRCADAARTLGEACGALRDVVRAESRLGLAAWARDDVATALRWTERALVRFRAMGDQHMELLSLRSMGAMHLESGDAHTASSFCVQAQALQEALDDQLEALHVTALDAHCQLRLGRPDAAGRAVQVMLGRLQGDLAGRPAWATIEIRWACQAVLDALGDMPATGLLERLHSDVQARVAELTDAADHERLIQAIPAFRDIVAAYGRRRLPPAGG